MRLQRHTVRIAGSGLSLARQFHHQDNQVLIAGATSSPGAAARPDIRVQNTGMEHPNEIERRLTDLEIKASFSEDLVDQLNLVVVRQQQQIDRLVQEVAHLRAQNTSADPAAFRSLRDELPPHY